MVYTNKCWKKRRRPSGRARITAWDPPAPAPSEDRFFTNWSSLGSPHVRMAPQSVPIEETGPDINQSANQTTQPGSEPTQIGAMGNALQDDIIVSSPRSQ